MIRDRVRRVNQRVGRASALLLYRSVWDGREFDEIEYRLEGHRLAVAPDGAVIEEGDLRDMIAYTYVFVGCVLGFVTAFALAGLMFSFESFVTGDPSTAAYQAGLGLAGMWWAWTVAGMQSFEIDVGDEVSEA